MPVFKTGAFNRSATSPADPARARKLLQSLASVQPEGSRAISQGNFKAMCGIRIRGTAARN
jgi:hypothetical protein